MDTIVLALIIVSLVLAAIDLFRSQGQSLTSWAVVVADVAIIIWLRA